MKEIFTNLKDLEKSIRGEKPTPLDTSENYYIKGQRSSNERIDIFKNSKDGSTYNLRFNQKAELVYWWHNKRTKKENINLSEGVIKKLPDGTYGFAIFSGNKNKEGQSLSRQGTIENPTIGNLKYLIEQTDLELVKLLKAAYPKKEIVSENANIQYHLGTAEVIEEAYKENEKYNQTQNSELLEEIQKIQEEIEKLQRMKQELEERLNMSKNNMDKKYDGEQL